MQNYKLSRDAICQLPPEMPGGLTFHLPMELCALEYAKAPSNIIECRTTEGLLLAFANGLIDPPLYRWALGRYADFGSQLLSPETAVRRDALIELSPLADGLAGAAFHGLIRLGYGAMVRDEGEVVRGLAYMRTRRQVIAPCQPLAQSPMNVASLCMELGPQESGLANPSATEGATVFDLLNLVGGTGAARSTIEPLNIDTISHQVELACQLVLAEPSSFVAIHALTGLAGLAELHYLVYGNSFSLIDKPEILPWWQTMSIAMSACALIVGPDKTERQKPTTKVDFHDLLPLSVQRSDTHDVKLCVSLSRLVHFGLLDDKNAVAVGRRRLNI